MENKNTPTASAKKTYCLDSFMELFCYLDAVKPNIKFDDSQIKNLNFVKMNLAGMAQCIKTVVKDLQDQGCIKKNDALLSVIQSSSSPQSKKKINFVQDEDNSESLEELQNENAFLKKKLTQLNQSLDVMKSKYEEIQTSMSGLMEETRKKFELVRGGNQLANLSEEEMWRLWEKKNEISDLTIKENELIILKMRNTLMEILATEEDEDLKKMVEEPLGAKLREIDSLVVEINQFREKKENDLAKLKEFKLSMDENMTMELKKISHMGAVTGQVKQIFELIKQIKENKKMIEINNMRIEKDDGKGLGEIEEEDEQKITEGEIGDVKENLEINEKELVEKDQEIKELEKQIEEKNELKKENDEKLKQVKEEIEKEMQSLQEQEGLEAETPKEDGDNQADKVEEGEEKKVE